jgi:hypothetical protein
VTEPDHSSRSTVEQVELLKDELIAHATGGQFLGGNDAYRQLRRELRARPDISPRLPGFVNTCADLGEFWDFIKEEFGTYRERRRYLRESFRPVIAHLESNGSTLNAAAVSEILTELNADSVNDVWDKALDRRRHDPEGAITAARTMLETVCKHILDDAGVTYNDHADLPRLWFLTAEQLNLAPSQHQEIPFRTILGNCQSVVSELANLRNTVGDAHGQGRRAIKPRAKHAELAVNLAGSMASFLVATWQEHLAHLETQEDT